MAAPSTEYIDAQVANWMRWDVNEATRASVAALDAATKAKRFGKRIAFGTAGLRGPMLPGLACMNDVTVLQASQGLCAHVLASFDDARERGVAICFDARRNADNGYNSRTFAQIAALVFLSKGVKVHLFSRFMPTPIVPYAMRAHGCVAGIVVTASHNPKADNGYKVYWANSAQIIAPTDVAIAAAIEANVEPWQGVARTDLDAALRAAPAGLLVDNVDANIDAYMRVCRETLSFRTREANAASTVPMTYSAMHGVGAELFFRAFAEFGLPPPLPVPAQNEPDPEFPTVAFPNPEEGRGALALSIETAEKNKSPVIFANDPDADRLAVAERQGDGEWRIFSGNELGALLGHWHLSKYIAAHPDADRAKLLLMNSTVSSKMLKGIADAEGCRYEDTLTGFKWMGNRADELARDGFTFVFAFEEAIGFMNGPIGLDKDGVRAGAMFGELVAELYGAKKTIASHLADLQDKYGFYANVCTYFFCYEPAVMEAIFDRLRGGSADKRDYPTACGDFKIKSVRDLTVGFDSSRDDRVPTLPVSKSSQMITFYFENGCVATLRGSGTEPKLKYYVDLPGKNKAEAEATLKSMVAAIVEHWLRPDENNLKPPNA